MSAQPVRPAADAAAQELNDFADRLDGPLECTSPAGGLGPGSHCAACCYNTGLDISCAEEQALADAAKALRIAASYLASGDGSGLPLLDVAGPRGMSR